VISRLLRKGSVISQTRMRTEDEQALIKRQWYRIRRWCGQRPCWGAFCILLASLLILWEPVSVLQSDISPTSTPWAGMLVGGLLLVMGLVALLAPTHALVAGAACVVLSLVSLITALGGFGIGMLLGIIGSSYVIAWQPERKAGRRPLFWSVLGSSSIIMLGMTTLIMRGELAIAIPTAGSFTTFAGRIECHNTHTYAAISRVDHRTPVIVSYSDYCISSHLVEIRHVMGRTVTITEATHTSAIARGITTEAVATHIGLEQDTDFSTTKLDQFVAVNVQYNVTSQTLFESSQSSTTPDISVSIS
jgi:Family of unknown function (DUF6114)